LEPGKDGAQALADVRADDVGRQLRQAEVRGKQHGAQVCNNLAQRVARRQHPASEATASARQQIRIRRRERIDDMGKLPPRGASRMG